MAFKSKPLRCSLPISMPLHKQKRERILNSKQLFLRQFPWLVNRKTTSFYNKNKIIFFINSDSSNDCNYLVRKIFCMYGKRVHIISPYLPSFSEIDPEVFLQIVESTLLDTNIKHLIIYNKIESFTDKWKNILKSAYSYGFFVIMLDKNFFSNVISSDFLNCSSPTSFLSENVDQKMFPCLPFPIYWGFFLNPSDYSRLLRTAKQRFSFCLQHFPKFKMALEDHFWTSEFEKIYYIDHKHLLHCTTFNQSSGGSYLEDYQKQEIVLKSKGKHFRIYIRSFFFTPRTVGISIILKKTSLKLWNNDDSFVYVEHPGFFPYPYQALPLDQETYSPKDFCYHYRGVSKNNKNFDMPNASNNEIKVSEKIKLKKGRRAHLTLGTSHRIQPVQTGYDCLSLRQKRIHDLTEEVVFEEDSSLIFYYPNECEIILNWPSPFDCVFNCYY